MSARAAELGLCVEGKYIWHNLEIQYASNQQQEKHKHFRRACVSPRDIKQWNNCVYQGTTLLCFYNNIVLCDFTHFFFAVSELITLPLVQK